MASGVGASSLSFVWRSEVVCISEVVYRMEIAIGATACVCCVEVVRILESPLLEVLLYVCIY